MELESNYSLEEISLVLLYKGEKVFTGSLEELHKFESNDQPADRARLFGDNDLPVVSISYDDLCKLI